MTQRMMEKKVSRQLKHLRCFLYIHVRRINMTTDWRSFNHFFPPTWISHDMFAQ
jgi:hypothetical protein